VGKKKFELERQEGLRAGLRVQTGNNTEQAGGLRTRSLKKLRHRFISVQIVGVGSEMIRLERQGEGICRVILRQDTGPWRVFVFTQSLGKEGECTRGGLGKPGKSISKRPSVMEKTKVRGGRVISSV